MQRVLLKIPRLAARVLVTDRSTGIEICTMKGTETRAWEPLQVTGSPPGGVKDAKAKSEPKRSDPRQRAHHCTSVADSWWELSCYSRTKMLDLLILSTRVQTQTCGDVRMISVLNMVPGKLEICYGYNKYSESTLSISLMSKEAISVKK